jgi:hypothetical protein
MTAAEMRTVRAVLGWQSQQMTNMANAIEVPGLAELCKQLGHPTTYPDCPHCDAGVFYANVWWARATKIQENAT